MTTARTTEPTTGETYTALAARYASAVNTADEVLCILAPLIMADTEAREAAAVSLTRSGARLTLDCGSRHTAEALWSAISAAALEVRREIVQDGREGPSPPVRDPA